MPRFVAGEALGYAPKMRNRFGCAIVMNQIIAKPCVQLRIRRIPREGAFVDFPVEPLINAAGRLLNVGPDVGDFPLVVGTRRERRLG